MERPIVSIIMPVYQVEKFIHHSINSIISQSVKSWELIIIDDGSTDNSGSICDKYVQIDHRISVIHTENHGVSVARNIGIKKATGKFIAFCDSDDYCDSEWLETMVKEAERSTSDLVITSYKKIDEESQVLSIRRRYSGVWNINDIDEKYNYIIEHILDKKGQWNGWELWTSLFNRDIIEKYKITFCESCENFAEDLGFVLKFILHCNIVSCIDCVTYYYVQHEQSMMARSTNVVKLNSLNEISIYFGSEFDACYCDKKYKYYYALIHFLLLNDQYEKIIFGDDTKRLPCEVERISNQEWFISQTHRLRHCRNLMLRFWDRRRCEEHLLWSRYAEHKNWKRFAMESAVLYKVLGRLKNG